MLRIETINALFYGGASGAFTTALRPIQQTSDLLVGGSVSGALIPTFVEYAAPERRAELRHVYSTVANLVAIVMVVALAGVALAAPYFVPLETHNFSPADQQLTAQLVRIAAFSLIGLSLYAVGSALLYALKETIYPAFATGLYHLGIIVCGVLVLLFALHQAGVPLSAALRPGSATGAVALARAIGARGLALGAAVGALGEFLLVLVGLRRIGVNWRPVLDLRHPAVRQILRLYGPLAIGLVISVAAQNLDVTLIGLTPGGAEKNATALVSALTLIQFPIGLVSAALSFAVLPLLVNAASANDMAAFKRTLVLGFRLGLVLMVPAMVGLLVIGTPIAALLFQHGACDQGCTGRNVLALRNMAYQLPFIALDQLLIAAYYARKNTVVPMLVGIASIVCYAVAAVPFAQTIGMPAIAFANSVQNTSHAVILFILLTLAIGNLEIRAFLDGVARIGLAAAGMAATCAGMLFVLPRLNGGLFSLNHLAGQVLTVALVGAAGAAVYFALAALLRVPEVRLLGGIVGRRLRG
jgi:putative peptidoglycan lipid II flippase